MNDGRAIIESEEVLAQLESMERGKEDAWLDLHSVPETPKSVDGITYVGEHGLPRYVRFRCTKAQCLGGREFSCHFYIETYECNEGLTWYVVVLYFGSNEEVILISRYIRELEVYLKLTFPHLGIDDLPDETE